MVEKQIFVTQVVATMTTKNSDNKYSFGTHLYKDKANRLLFVSEGRFLMEVDYYTAKDKSNQTFKLYGITHQLALVKGTKLYLSNFFSQCAATYRAILQNMVEEAPTTRDKWTFLKKITIKKNSWYNILNALIRLISFGFVRINPIYAYECTIPKGNYCTGYTLQAEFIEISYVFFDKLKRVENVKDQYCDIAGLWVQDIITRAKSKPPVSESTEPTGSNAGA